MDKKLEMDFFKVFDTGGVLWNCFELIDKKYDLGEQKREGRKELSEIEQRLNDEILQHIKEQTVAFDRNYPTFTTIDEVNSLDVNRVVVKDSLTDNNPLIDEISKNLDECKDAKQYIYSLLRPFKEYSDRFNPISIIKSGKENYNIGRAKNVSDIYRKLCGASESWQEGTVEYCMEHLLNYLHRFACRLDALLLERGENLLWYQNECGIYLLECRDIDVISNYIGSEQLARKYISESSPEFPQKQENSSLKSNELNLPSELNTERAQKYFTKAIEFKYIIVTDKGLQWVFGGVRGRKASLGYFIQKVFCPQNTGKIPETSINKLFGVNRIGSAINQIASAKKPQKWIPEIHNLFE